MNLEDRLEAFNTLGREIANNIKKVEYENLMKKAEVSNPWFTQENQVLALKGICRFLEKDALYQWTENYTFANDSRIVGVVMAGNIPLVGFHDLLCILISGHRAQVKLSSKDSILIRFLIDKLIEIAPGFSELVTWTDRLSNFDAVIATGSDNSARYFQSYFGKVPNIIRKNRVSCAVLNGEETDEDLQGLADDIFQYFGLGCRSVSKLYIPENYDLGLLDQPFSKYSNLEEHNKYANNYLYNRSILLMNSKKFRENGFMIMQETSELTSPVSVVYYEYYPEAEYLEKKLDRESDKLQCIVANKPFSSRTVGFGQTQQPELSDYPDNIDTLKFLTEI